MKKIRKSIYLIIIYVLIIITAVIMTVNEGIINRDINQMVFFILGMVLLGYGGVCLYRTRNIFTDRDACVSDIKPEGGCSLNVYEKLAEHRKNISFLRHDFANHVQIVESMAEDMADKDVIDRVYKISDELNKDKFRYCLHPVLDVAIEDILQILDSDNIDYETDIILNIQQINNYEDFCILLKILILNLKECISKDGKMYIKIYIKEEDGKSYITYKCESHKNHKKPDKVDYVFLNWLTEKNGGTFMVSDSRERIVTAGIYEIR